MTRLKEKYTQEAKISWKRKDMHFNAKKMTIDKYDEDNEVSDYMNGKYTEKSKGVEKTIYI